MYLLNGPKRLKMFLLTNHYETPVCYVRGGQRGLGPSVSLWCGGTWSDCPLPWIQPCPQASLSTHLSQHIYNNNANDDCRGKTTHQLPKSYGVAIPSLLEGFSGFYSPCMYLYREPTEPWERALCLRRQALHHCPTYPITAICWFRCNKLANQIERKLTPIKGLWFHPSHGFASGI